LDRWPAGTPTVASTIVWNGALSGLIDPFFSGGGALYGLLILAEVAAVALLLRARRRRLQLAAAHAWTEPLDLQTLRARMRTVEPEAQATGLRHTRELLDDLRRQRTDVGPGFGGIAGSSRRR